MKSNAQKNYSRSYVDYPQFPTIRKFVCKQDRCIYINTAAPVNGESVRVLEMFPTDFELI
ncbi:MAG: hypothetical protein II319_09190 [Clostridia bacterium]|jgi:hypothetical protein|nr:hypothetical protein [Clostridia bacterium]